MIDKIIEAIELFMQNGEDQESLDREIDGVLDELQQKLNEDDSGENIEAVAVLPIQKVITELKFVRNNIFSEACYAPDIFKSLESLRSFLVFFKSPEESHLDKCEECPDIHANLDNYFNELLTDIPENQFLTANYLEILDAVDEYEDSGIPEALLKLVDDKVRSARGLKEKYLNLSITEREISQEFLAGNEFLLSGLDLWEEALLTVGEGCNAGDQVKIQNALEKLDEANEILVVVQHHAGKVREKSL